ncbi:MAG: DUF87 domain-containing protein, partial [Oscillospiraceae bacterium]|nr:DUF87 domain-containing protein [Oscillospiraceae bacterium]
KVTLYDKRYSGKVNVTAVKRSVLSEEAETKRKGGMFNYTPCIDADDIERIPLGTDEKGRKVYWSIGHEELGNAHMLVNGISGMGKSTAVNLIVKELYDRQKNIVYIDFSNSDSEEKLERSGFDRKFLGEHFCHMSISKCLDDDEELDSALSLMKSDRIILIFEAEKYDKDTEQFLDILYSKVVSDSTLSIFLVIDEAHDLDFKKGSVLYNIMEKGRGNGISLISIFQGPHETTPRQYSMMNQAELKLIFRLSDKIDAHKVAEADSLKPLGEFAVKMMNLKKKKCLAIGSLESDDGELYSGRFIEITITDI